MKAAIQLYTVRERPEPLPAIIDDVGDTVFEGVEFAYRVHEADADVAAVRDALDRNGLAAAGAHLDEDVLAGDRAALLDTLDTVGVEDAILAWLDPEHFTNVSAVAETARRLNDLADEFEAVGMDFHYHNHEQEFVETDAGVAFHALADRTEDVNFEFDAGWALAAGMEPVALIERYADRISHVHLKDVAPDASTEPQLGEGRLDIERVVAAAEDAGATWVVYENDAPADPATAHAHGADVLSTYL